MRIGITIDEGVSPIAGGIGQYVRNLVRHLTTLAPDEQFILIYARKRGTKRFELPAVNNVSWVEIPIPRLLLHRFLWPFLDAPLVERFTGPLDIMHITTSTTNVPTKAPIIATVHDLFPEKYPHHFKWTGRFFRGKLLAQIERRAKFIIAISEATKGDVLELLEVSSAKIKIIPEALPRRPETPLSLEREFIKSYKLQQPYILFVGRADLRKNVKALIEAFSLFVKTVKIPYLLVLGGSSGWKAEELKKYVERLDLKERVLFLGYVPDEYIGALMRNAVVFAYPSLYEGFGLPLLEAMFYGVPIVASNISSIPEVAGLAANYFDPLDPSDICRALVEVVENPTLRTTLVEEGHKRLAGFSWEKTAQKTLEIYYNIRKV